MPFEERKEKQDLLLKYSNLFSTENSLLHKIKINYHKIAILSSIKNTKSIVPVGRKRGE